MLGKRIKNVHLKEYSKKVHEFNLHTFRPLLDGTTNWPAVLEALDAGRLPRLPDVRVLQPFAPLARGAGLSDLRRPGPDAGPQGVSERSFRS